jgi:hypothetical protein
VALAPKGPDDFVLNTDGLSWWEERRTVATVREDDVREYRHARQYQQRQRNANELMRETWRRDQALDADLQAVLHAKPSPRLEAMAHERFKQWATVSTSIIAEAYGNG